MCWNWKTTFALEIQGLGKLREAAWHCEAFKEDLSILVPPTFLTVTWQLWRDALYSVSYQTVPSSYGLVVVSSSWTFAETNPTCCRAVWTKHHARERGQGRRNAVSLWTEFAPGASGTVLKLRHNKGTTCLSVQRADGLLMLWDLPSPWAAEQLDSVADENIWHCDQTAT